MIAALKWAPWALAGALALALAFGALLLSKAHTERLEAQNETAEARRDLSACAVALEGTRQTAEEEALRASRAAQVCTAEQERLRRVVASCATADAAVERLNSLGDL